MAKMNLIDSDPLIKEKASIVPKKVALIACPLTFFDHVELENYDGYVSNVS